MSRAVGGAGASLPQTRPSQQGPGAGSPPPHAHALPPRVPGSAGVPVLRETGVCSRAQLPPGARGGQRTGGPVLQGGNGARCPGGTGSLLGEAEGPGPRRGGVGPAGRTPSPAEVQARASSPSAGPGVPSAGRGTQGHPPPGQQRPRPVWLSTPPPDSGRGHEVAPGAGCLQLRSQCKELPVPLWGPLSTQLSHPRRGSEWQHLSGHRAVRQGTPVS